MTGARWIVQFLKLNGTTDIFGLPGAVILDFLYATDEARPEVTPHLCYHEQAGAMEACGYAQSTGSLGVAYATRGPGFTNMLTAMADAYYDSIPTMFFTAHSSNSLKDGMRAEDNQEIDTVALANPITKYSIRIDDADEIPENMKKAFLIATSGRKGPVFLDISAAALKREISETPTKLAKEDRNSEGYAVELVKSYIEKAHRPVFLIGNGIRQANVENLVRELAEQMQIPVVSSRAAQDIMPSSDMFFGHIGSHGTRYGNFILSKADLIISLGNRLSFPTKSASFRPIVENATVLRIEIDRGEFQRNIPGSINVQADLCSFIPEMLKDCNHYDGIKEWVGICKTLRTQLEKWDRLPVVATIEKIMRSADGKATFVCDVGNHGFWVTNAYAYSNVNNRILYSNAFGTLGSGLPKAIGACCGQHCPVICFTGDQGFQMNMQELSLISKEQLPITIVILNNESSGMILERERARYGERAVHTTKESGYTHPDFEKLATAYGITYRLLDCVDTGGEEISLAGGPEIIELRVDIETKLHPNLPLGSPCQDLTPFLERDFYKKLNQL